MPHEDARVDRSLLKTHHHRGFQGMLHNRNVRAYLKLPAVIIRRQCWKAGIPVSVLLLDGQYLSQDQQHDVHSDIESNISTPRCSLGLYYIRRIRFTVQQVYV